MTITLKCCGCSNVRSGNSPLGDKKCITDPSRRDVWSYIIVNPSTGLPSNGNPPHPSWCPLAAAKEAATPLPFPRW